MAFNGLISLFSLGCLLLVVTAHGGRYRDRGPFPGRANNKNHPGPRPGNQPQLQVNVTQCQLEQPPCGLCGKPINVTVRATNLLVAPNFDLVAAITGEPQRELLSFLEQAVELLNGFKFKSTYFAGLGYFIDSINGVEGSIPNKTFWHISSAGKALECVVFLAGVSSYVPKKGEVILFNFTTYAAAGYE
ncbi:unnamed protein product [Lymnaea stagnalis]|uniref:Transcobalamin-like C-terminal domain-containing protein n=1 Tax=Lymnaea stagnalis TaxID=6523 RepID=A0AAV2I380_LYMST